MIIFVFSALHGFSQSTKARDTVLLISYSSFGMTGDFNMEIDSAKIMYKEVLRREPTFPQPAKLDPEKKFMAKLSAGEWSSITYLVSTIDLKKLDSLQSPTNHRAVDGAWYASLAIKTTTGTYRTKDFDEGIPMRVIKNLLWAIDRIMNHRLVEDRYEELIKQRD